MSLEKAHDNPAAVSVRSGKIVRRSGCPKHKMARFKRGALSGWNYRAYCVVEKVDDQAGARWQMADESGDEWAWFFRTLAEFRSTCDRWERQRAKEAARAETSPNVKGEPRSPKERTKP